MPSMSPEVQARLNTLLARGLGYKTAYSLADTITRADLNSAIAGIGTAAVTSVASKTGAVTLVKADVGLDQVNNTSDANKPISTLTATALQSKADLVSGKVPVSQLPASSGGSAVSSVASRTGDVVLTKADVGLTNADNTADINKPISTATAQALQAKADLNQVAASASVVARSAKINGDQYLRYVQYADGSAKFGYPGNIDHSTYTPNGAFWTLIGRPNAPTLHIRSGYGSDDTVHSIFEIADYLDALILWLLNTGGLRINDQFGLSLSVFGPDWIWGDIYGAWRQRGFVNYRHDGPPGNAFDYPTACGENYDGDRAASTGTLQTAYGASAISSVANPFGGGVNHPGESFHVFRTQQYAGSNLIVLTGTAPTLYIPVLTGNWVKMLCWARADVTTRDMTAGIQWSDSDGNYVNGEISASPVAVGAGGWTLLAVGGQVPAGATGAAFKVTAPGLVANEVDWFSALGCWVDNRTTDAQDPNPENVWSPPLCAQDVGGSYRAGSRTGDTYQRGDQNSVVGKRAYALDGVRGQSYAVKQIGAPGSDKIPRWVSTDGQATTTVTTPGAGDTGVVTSSQKAGSYTLMLADVGATVDFTGSSAAVATVPNSSSVVFPVGAVIELTQLGTGQLSVTGASGVIINTAASTQARAQYSVLSLRYLGSNIWLLSGDLA